MRGAHSGNGKGWHPFDSGVDSNLKNRATSLSPIGWWKMNEGSGNNFLDTVAGNTLINTLSGPIWEGSPAAGLNAPYMVVTGAQSPPWSTASGSLFNFSATTAFSVSVWLLLNNVNYYSQIVGNFEASPSYTGWEIDTEAIGSGLVSFYLASNITNNQFINVTIPASDVTTGTAFHLVVTYSGSKTAAGVLMYVNGVAVSTTIATDTLGSNAVSSTSPLLLASRIDGSTPLGSNGGIPQPRKFYPSFYPSMGIDLNGNWDGVCACGKRESDGVRCRLGATHKPPIKHAFPWEAPQPNERKMPWEK